MRPVNNRDKAAPGDYLCVQKVPPRSLRFLGDSQTNFSFDGVMDWRTTQGEVFKGVPLRS